MIGEMRKLKLRAKRFITNRLCEINKEPIFVVGNQKSGTTVIAALLAKYAGYSHVLDFDYKSAHEVIDVLRSDYNFGEFIDSHKLEFSKDLVKEPHLTFLLPELIQYFPEAKFVIIIRDPRDNIRSILDRVDIVGDKSDVCVRKVEIREIWKKILLNVGLGLESGSYVERLSRRWKLATETYFNYADDLNLIRYEDFLEDKTGSIHRLADDLALDQKNRIEKEVDVQYQPRGNRNVDWFDFFGKENLAIIENVCGPYMSELGYEKTT